MIEQLLHTFSMDLPVLLSIFILGIAIGLIGGLFGIGGGFIMTPVLNIFFGLPMSMAIGTTIAQIFGSAVITSFYQRDFSIFKNPAVPYIVLGIPLGALGGTKIVVHLKDMGDILIGGSPISVADIVLLGVYLVFLLLLLAWVFYDTIICSDQCQIDNQEGRGYFSRLRIPPVRSFPLLKNGEFSIPVLIMLGCFKGFLGGLLGIGGGVIMLPMLYYLVGQTMKDAVRTCLLIVLVSSLFSSIYHGLYGNIMFHISLLLILGTSVGSFAGVSLHKKISGKLLSQYFVLILLLAIVPVIWKLLSVIFI